MCLLSHLKSICNTLLFISFSFSFFCLNVFLCLFPSSTLSVAHPFQYGRRVESSRKVLSRPQQLNFFYSFARLYRLGPARSLTSRLFVQRWHVEWQITHQGSLSLKLTNNALPIKLAASVTRKKSPNVC